MRGPARRPPHGQTKLHPTPPVESFRQVLEGQIVNRRNHGTGRERRRSVLNVKHVDGMAPQFSRKRQRNAHQRCMRQRFSYFEIGPTIIESIDSCLFGDVECVKICLIDFSESFDQVSSVAFIPAEFGSDGMRVDRDVQGRIIFHFSFFIFHLDVASTHNGK